MGPPRPSQILSIAAAAAAADSAAAAAAAADAWTCVANRVF